MVQSLLHILAVAVFAAVSVGAFALIVSELLGSRRLVASALLGESHSVSAQPWPSRVRLVSRPPAAPPRLARQLRAIA